MVNGKENKLGWFWPKMSHAQKGVVTHSSVMPFKMEWLILGTERYGGTGCIDVATGVHVELSHSMCIGVAPS
jgi:hypothetical protein